MAVNGYSPWWIPGASRGAGRRPGAISHPPTPGPRLLVRPGRHPRPRRGAHGQPLRLLGPLLREPTNAPVGPTVGATHSPLRGSPGRVLGVEEHQPVLSTSPCPRPPSCFTPPRHAYRAQRGSVEARSHGTSGPRGRPASRSPRSRSRSPLGVDGRELAGAVPARAAWLAPRMRVRRAGVRVRRDVTHPQDVSRLDLAVVLLRAKSNDHEDSKLPF